MPPHLKVGLLAIQGAFAEHRSHLVAAAAQLQLSGTPCTVEVVEVRRSDQLTADLNALIIPGGESTTVAKFVQRSGLLEAFQTWFHEGNPHAVVWGICAGLIALSDSVADMKIGGQTLIRGLGVTTDRNFYGRQRESFECPVKVTSPDVFNGCSDSFPGIFIRAPRIVSIDRPDRVRVLACIGPDGDNPVAVMQDRILATSFHPELTDDSRFHRLLLNMILQHSAGQ